MQNLDRISMGKGAVVSVPGALPPPVSHLSRGKLGSVAVAVRKHEVTVLLAALRSLHSVKNLVQLLSHHYSNLHSPLPMNCLQQGRNICKVTCKALNKGFVFSVGASHT